MNNYVILLAGGLGKRMRADIPKQFLEVNGKPILVYTLENFQKNPQIEKILVVCVKDWIENLNLLIQQYKLSKVAWIVEGGPTGHDSIRNGIFFLKSKIKSEDFIVVHDSVRPIVPQKMLNNLLKVAHKKGNAVAATECHPPIVYTEDFKSGNKSIDRDQVMLASSPQAFMYSLVLDCYEQAEKENLHNTIFTSSLLIHCGKRVYFSKGTMNNIKITQKEDLALFRALLQIPEDELYF